MKLPVQAGLGPGLRSEVKAKAKTFSDRVLGTIKERRAHGIAEDDVMDTWAWAGPHGYYNKMHWGRLTWEKEL